MLIGFLLISTATVLIIWRVIFAASKVNKISTKDAEPEKIKTTIVQGSKPIRAYFLPKRKTVYISAYNPELKMVLISYSKGLYRAFWVPVGDVVKFKQRKLFNI